MRAFKLAVSGLAVVLISLGCSADDQATPTAPEGSQNAIAAPPAYNLWQDSTGEISGRVILEPALDGKALVVAVTVGPEANAPVARIFVLQAERSLRVSAQNYPSAWVRYSRAGVVIGIPTAQQGYVLRVSDKEVFSPPTGVPANRMIALTGFGLSQRHGSFALENGGIPPATVSEIASVSCSNPPSFGTIGIQNIAPLCGIGGPGSTSCGVTCSPDPTRDPPQGCGYSCHTSCGSGYYACCGCRSGCAMCSCYRNR